MRTNDSVTRSVTYAMVKDSFLKWAFLKKRLTFFPSSHLNIQFHERRACVDTGVAAVTLPYVRPPAIFPYVRLLHNKHVILRSGLRSVSC